MGARLFLVKSTVAAGLLTVVFSLPVAAQQATPPTIEELFDQLQRPGVDSAAVAQQLADRWSRSGSASMDLLLARGREALEAGDPDTAIGFFSALIDHAPEFAYGYVARANAYFSAGLAAPALADVQSALALEPRHLEAIHMLAVMLEEFGSDEEAYAAWQILSDLAPHDPEVKDALIRLKSGEKGTLL